ncbi:hypothetical protein BLNAU_203 [Blattamonas nauphoetae]|uniref:Uncharacterized protein n=1 Tax=Blattamonas nauphoetae TaxID=2049346 RepID=A0ABQ9YMD4_9EUKA|nr:hypothetical protein BLNAU_203 [Blattamonas nauphoetae]
MILFITTLTSFILSQELPETQILQFDKPASFTFTKESPLHVALIPVTERYSIYSTMTVKLFSSSRKIVPFIRLVMSEKDALPTVLNYDYTCTKWEPVSNFGSMPMDLSPAMEQLAVQGYSCDLTYQQFDLKPGIYSLSMFFNTTPSTTPKRDKKKEGIDLEALSEQYGITVSATPLIKSNDIQLLIVATTFIGCGFAWAFSNWAIVIDVVAIVLTGLLTFSRYYLNPKRQTENISYFSTLSWYVLIPFVLPLTTVLYKISPEFKHKSKLKIAREVVTLVGMSYFCSQALFSFVELQTETKPMLIFCVTDVLLNLFVYIAVKRRMKTKKAFANEVDPDVIKHENRRQLAKILQKGVRMQEEADEKRRKERRKRRKLVMEQQKRREAKAKRLAEGKGTALDDMSSSSTINDDDLESTEFYSSSEEERMRQRGELDGNDGDTEFKNNPLSILDNEHQQQSDEDIEKRLQEINAKIAEISADHED